MAPDLRFLERTTGFEPATLTLERFWGTGSPTPDPPCDTRDSERAIARRGQSPAQSCRRRPYVAAHPAASHEVAASHGQSVPREAARAARARHADLRTQHRRVPLSRRRRSGIGPAHLREARNEDEARDKAREFEQLISHAASIRDPHGRPRTLAHLAERYSADHLAGLSLRYREKQEYLLRRWVLPRLADTHISRWTPADSAAVLAAVPFRPPPCSSHSENKDASSTRAPTAKRPPTSQASTRGRRHRRR